MARSNPPRNVRGLVREVMSDPLVAEQIRLNAIHTIREIIPWGEEDYLNRLYRNLYVGQVLPLAEAAAIADIGEDWYLINDTAFYRGICVDAARRKGSELLSKIIDPKVALTEKLASIDEVAGLGLVLQTCDAVGFSIDDAVLDWLDGLHPWDKLLFLEDTVRGVDVPILVERWHPRAGGSAERSELQLAYSRRLRSLYGDLAAVLANSLYPNHNPGGNSL